MKRLLATVAALTFILVAYKYNSHLADMIEWVKHQGVLAPIFFIALYCISSIIAFPGLLLTLAGGALFGPLWGTIINLIGATLGATGAFLLSRYCLYDWVKKKSGPRLSKIIKAIDKQGWTFAAFIRVVPLVPFNIANFILGVTSIKLIPYVLTTFIFMMPAEVAYTYAGFSGSKAIIEGEKYLANGLIVLAILAAMALLPMMILKFKPKLRGRSPTINLSE